MIKATPSIPAGLKKIKGRRIVLAHGEVTGHAHALNAKHATGYHAELTAPDTEASYIEVAEALADLTHEEHDTIPLPAGTYQIIIQREYSPETIQRVLD